MAWVDREMRAQEIRARLAAPPRRGSSFANTPYSWRKRYVAHQLMLQRMQLSERYGAALDTMGIVLGGGRMLFGLRRLLRSRIF